MTQITPERFKDAFLQVVSARETDLLTRWDAPYDYTLFMQHTVLAEIAPLLGLEYFPEYYKIDGIYFAERDLEHFAQGSTYATSLSVALEHENDIRYSAHEVNKLQLYNTPLKVLITYSTGGPEAKPDIVAAEHKFYLERYAKILRKGDIFNDFASLRRHLIIFGSVQKVEGNYPVKWEFYAYESSGFQELNACPVTLSSSDNPRAGHGISPKFLDRL